MSSDLRSRILDDRMGPPGVNKDAIRRLRRAEGQVKGVIRMVESEAYCIDILDQLAAAQSALRKAGLSVLRRHVEHCVTGAADDPSLRESLVEELIRSLERRAV